MAFNFNWSPLIADTSRAREMLTNALNKSPKPPIIVDDIVVTELNLGSTPPSLEILEVGDLAEDRFRGIFKMVYSGDAFLTLKTRVQANPLNTYLSTKPSFASPQPLAAASGLTIPLAITLSDIRLSGFVILVFSKQKGVTLVFRNDPLESLKVSSTFDSIPFVRDYLQNEIEKQLRLLFMEDLPAIIHRLSLRLFVPPDHQQASAELNSNTHLDNGPSNQGQPIDPLSSPPQGPAAVSDGTEGQGWFSLDDSASSSSYSFSQKNLIRLGALNDSHRTLSLFTPPIRDVVFRAWAGSSEHGREVPSRPQLATAQRSGLTLASLRDQNGRIGSSERLSTGLPSLRSSSSDGQAPDSVSETMPNVQRNMNSTRPSLANTSYSSFYSYSTGSTLVTGASRPRTRKRKHRIVNLRRVAPDGTGDSPTNDQTMAATDRASRPTTPTSATAPASSSWATESSREDDEINTPPESPNGKSTQKSSPDQRTPHASRRQQRLEEGNETVRPSRHTKSALQQDFDDLSTNLNSKMQGNLLSFRETPSTADDAMPEIKASSSSSPVLSTPSYPLPFPNYGGSAQPGGILEQAWLMKMAAEITRRAESERRKQNEDFWNGKWDTSTGELEARGPPPAYGA
ncbi:MAG: hypothetical protein Q9162_006130 [Coniocarpon cinnabarinum]